MLNRMVAPHCSARLSPCAASRHEQTLTRAPVENGSALFLALSMDETTMPPRIAPEAHTGSPIGWYSTGFHPPSLPCGSDGGWCLHVLSSFQRTDDPDAHFCPSGRSLKRPSDRFWPNLPRVSNLSDFVNPRCSRSRAGRPVRGWKLGGARGAWGDKNCSLISGSKSSAASRSGCRGRPPEPAGHAQTEIVIYAFSPVLSTPITLARPGRNAREQEQPRRIEPNRSPPIRQPWIPRPPSEDSNARRGRPIYGPGWTTVNLVGVCPRLSFWSRGFPR